MWTSRDVRPARVRAARRGGRRQGFLPGDPMIASEDFRALPPSVLGTAFEPGRRRSPVHLAAPLAPFFAPLAEDFDEEEEDDDDGGVGLDDDYDDDDVEEEEFDEEEAEEEDDVDFIFDLRRGQRAPAMA